MREGEDEGKAMIICRAERRSRARRGESICLDYAFISRLNLSRRSSFLVMQPSSAAIAKSVLLIVGLLRTIVATEPVQLLSRSACGGRTNAFIV